jgi:hypothetical protein
MRETMRRILSTLLLTAAATCVALGLIDTSTIPQNLLRPLAVEGAGKAPARALEGAGPMKTSYRKFDGPAADVAKPERIALR